MATRSIASLSLTFGLVSIPVKLYSATESSSAVGFKLMGPGGARVRQNYVADALPAWLAEARPLPAPEPALAPARSRAAARAGSAGVVDLPARRAHRPAGPSPSSWRRQFRARTWSRATSFRKDSLSSSRLRS